MRKKRYCVEKVNKDFPLTPESEDWPDLETLIIDNYLWVKNHYHPKVEVKLCYSERFVYVFFQVFEEKIIAKYQKFQDPVYKDSCVEFFFNPFPKEEIGYLNIETNALGTMLIGLGRSRNERLYMKPSDVFDFVTASSVQKPVSGYHGCKYWTITYKIPMRFIEKYYHQKISSGQMAKGNFYKCGNKTDYEHYGVWNIIKNPFPDFHRPEYFGEILFL